MPEAAAQPAPVPLPLVVPPDAPPPVEPAPVAPVTPVAPVPLAMLQSAKDEYVSEADYRAMFQAAREPKRQILIPASNHRFTDRLPELGRAYDEALAWIAEAKR